MFFASTRQGCVVHTGAYRRLPSLPQPCQCITSMCLRFAALHAVWHVRMHVHGRCCAQYAGQQVSDRHTRSCPGSICSSLVRQPVRRVTKACCFESSDRSFVARVTARVHRLAGAQAEHVPTPWPTVGRWSSRPLQRVVARTAQHPAACHRHLSGTCMRMRAHCGGPCSIRCTATSHNAGCPWIGGESPCQQKSRTGAAASSPRWMPTVS